MPNRSIVKAMLEDRALGQWHWFSTRGARDITTRDAPEWKFLAEAEQNETLRAKGLILNMYFQKCSPPFSNFFHYCKN